MSSFQYSVQVCRPCSHSVQSPLHTQDLFAEVDLEMLLCAAVGEGVMSLSKCASFGKFGCSYAEMKSRHFQQTVKRRANFSVPKMAAAHHSLFVLEGSDLSK